MRVKLLTEREQAGFQTKELSLLSLTSGKEANVVLIFSPDWPAAFVANNNVLSVTDLTAVVQSFDAKNKSSPLAVVDRFGGTEAATFCALTSLLKQLEFEAHVDVYEYAKTSHSRRPGVWRTQDEYFFLYRVFDTLCAGAAANSTPSVSSSTASAYSPNGPFEESSFQTFQPISLVAVNNHHHHHFVAATSTLPRSGTMTTIVRVPTSETVASAQSRETLLRSNNEVFNNQRY